MNARAVSRRSSTYELLEQGAIKSIIASDNHLRSGFAGALDPRWLGGGWLGNECQCANDQQLSHLFRCLRSCWPTLAALILLGIPIPIPHSGDATHGQVSQFD